MLSELTIKALKPKSKEYMIADGGGLYILVRPNGGKYWIRRYSSNGKAYKHSLGTYPEMSLKRARELVREAKVDIGLGGKFSKVFSDWFETQIKGVVSEEYATQIQRRAERHILPVLGDMPLGKITASVILNMLKSIEAEGKHDTVHRLKGYCSQIFRYAVASGQAESDPTTALRGALKPHKERHRATLTDIGKIRQLLACMTDFDGSFIVQKALWFSAYTFCRPGEIRKAEWSEIDLDGAEWKIPAEKMKMRRLHIVPLSRQAVDVLREVRRITGHCQYVFPSSRSSKGTVPMSENTILYAIRRMGFGPEEMTAHGFRGMASTRLHEMGYPTHVIERQLAHADSNNVRAAYNHAEYLDERRKLMQEWADWLDSVASQNR